MKTVDTSQFTAHAADYLEASRTETIIVTEDGKPRAVLKAVDYDEEQLELVNSPEFWAMIEERRRQPTIPWSEALKRINAEGDAP